MINHFIEEILIMRSQLPRCIYCQSKCSEKNSFTLKIKDDGVHIISERFKFLIFKFIILETSNVLLMGILLNTSWRILLIMLLRHY